MNLNCAGCGNQDSPPGLTAPIGTPVLRKGTTSICLETKQAKLDYNTAFPGESAGVGPPLALRLRNTGFSGRKTHKPQTNARTDLRHTNQAQEPGSRTRLEKCQLGTAARS